MSLKQFIKRLIRYSREHFDYGWYWDMREYVYLAERTSLFSWLKRRIFHQFVKKMEGANQAYIGLMPNGGGTAFASRPELVHGLNGIVISEKAIIGKNCTIFLRVTIGAGPTGVPTIGNNCLIGANATIIGGISIGNNVKIGAGCVVSQDIPDDMTVVSQKPIMIGHG